MFDRLFGLKPPNIAHGTVLQYSAGQFPRLCDNINSMSGFCCYCNTTLPIESGTAVTVYKKKTLFGTKYYVKLNGKNIDVTLYE